MKNTKAIFFFFLFCIFLKSDPLEAKAAYAQLSGLTSQVPSLDNHLIRMDSIDAIMNIDVGADKKHVIIKESGDYFIMTLVQAGSIDQTTTGYVDIWLIRNQQPMANTTSRATVELATSIRVLVSQTVLSLRAGDKIAVGYGASGPSLGIIFQQPELEPAITSVTFTIFKL